MIEHLSYSSISTFLTCGEHWRRKYLSKQRSPSTPALIFGSAFHNTVEAAISARTMQLPVQLESFWIDSWNKQVEANPDCEWGADTPEEHFNEGIRILLTPEVKNLVDSLTPLSDSSGLWIERQIELRVPGVPVPIIGFVDIVTADRVPGDFKTSKYRWADGKAEDELQTLFYLAALNQMGFEVPGMRFRHYVITKAKKPEVQIIEHSHNYSQVFWLFDLVQRVWRAIESESFTYGPNSWLCSPKYCSYYSECRGRS